jgi:hypothetical protein
MSDIVCRIGYVMLIALMAVGFVWLLFNVPALALVVAVFGGYAVVVTVRDAFEHPAG